MTFKKLMPLTFAALLGTGATLQAGAQSAVDGAIGGTVEDKSGAILPKAVVTIVNDGTNAQQQVVADDSGYFRVIHLQPGLYTVRVEASGFASYKSEKVDVTVGSLTNVQPLLTPGAGAETVEVSSAAPSINTTNNDFSNTIDLKVLEDLPVNNYRWSSYALLTPGVVAGGGFGLLSFRGQSTLLNNITFDGADDNQAFFSEERGRTRVGYSTAKSSILEFQVNTSNYSVEYGRSAGGVVNAVTRSGTNDFHGEAYFYDRDTEFGAKNPFVTRAVQTGLSATGQPQFSSQVFKPKDWRKQTGLGVGGPIVKDKLFFYFAFDKFLHNFPGVGAPSNPTFFYSVPDAATTCTGTTTATADGAVCQLAANLSGLAPVLNQANGKVATPAVNSVTPAQYTTAYNTYTSGIAGLNSILGLTPRTGDQGIFFGKLDYQFNGKNRITLELNRLRWASPAGIQTNAVVNYGVRSFGDDFVKDTFAIGKLDTALTPRISNEIRYQYGRDFEYEFNQVATPYENATTLNTGANSTAPNYVNPYQIAPNVNITNAFQYGTATFLNRPAYPDERRYQIADTVNFVRGNHNFKFGIDYLHTNDLSQNLFSQYGGYSYGGSNFSPYQAYFSDLNKNNACFSAVQDPVSKRFNNVPVECYTGYTQAFGPIGFEFQTRDYAGFLQDEWKVKPRLSLTLGLRYEYQQQPSAQIPNTTAEAITPFVNGSTNVLPDNRSNFGPRVGFAIDVFGDGRTSVRGGYGDFFARLENSTIYNALAQTGSPTGQLSINVSNSLQSFGAASAPTFPKIVNPNGFSAASALSSGNVAVVYFDRNFKLPEIQQADLTIEQDLGYKTTLGVTWLASFGRRLPDFVDTNLPAANDSVTYTFQAGGPELPGTSVTIPYYRKVGTGNGRPNAAFGSTTDIFSGVNSNYEGLVFQLTHKTTHNLSFSANYTWSHALDYGENNATFSDTNDLLDPRNLRGEYGNSNQNIPNRLVVYGVYNTPSHYKGVLGYLLNNYEISPSFQGQSGAPYTAGVSGNFNGVTLGSGALNTGSNGSASSSGGINGTGGTARLPNLDRNVFHFRRVLDLDTRLSKRFRVMDRVDLEILAESFNIFNHLNQTGVGSTTAYAFNSQAPNPNQLQLNSPFATFNTNTFQGNANNNLIYTPRQVQLGARIQF